MPKPKYPLTLREVAAPLREPVTKFGGQPVWISEPQWPLSQMYGTPMQFICQIRLSPELFGSLEAQMAYVFMTESTSETVLAETWDPDAGENAVILQPGTWTGPSLPLAEGPSLYKLVPDASGWPRTRVSCEFAVDLQLGADPEELEQPWPDVDDEAAWHARFQAFLEDKIGGIPGPAPSYAAFPYPGEGAWQLILQLVEEDERFDINFGTDGTGYVLLSEDGKVGKFLWMRS
jgi:hypothetical protein